MWFVFWTDPGDLGQADRGYHTKFSLSLTVEHFQFDIAQLRRKTILSSYIGFYFMIAYVITTNILYQCI